MEKIIFQAGITGLGAMAKEMFNEGMAIIFDKQVEATVPDLAEYSILLNIKTRDGQIAPGQKLRCGEQEFDILAVGDVVNGNIKNLGHSVLVFDGSTSPLLPGNIHLTCAPVPPIEAGTQLTIYQE